MSVFRKSFQIEVSRNQNSIIEFVEGLSGWQVNRGNWQQGRFRTLKINYGEVETSIAIVETFSRLFSLTRVEFTFETVEFGSDVTLIGDAKFSRGISVLIAFFVIMLSAIIMSNSGILIKGIYSTLIIVVWAVTFLGIYRDREDLISDLEQM